MEQQDICPNCFAHSYKNGECSRCGYQLSFDSHTGSRILPAGTTLRHRYCVGKVLGEGGFGITYKAYDTQRGQICAIKEFAPNGMCRRGADGRTLELISSSSKMPYMAGLKRFMEESQILIKLGNIPSVVNISESFQENATAYFVMEYLDGADLGQIVRAAGKRLPVAEVTDIILQVAVSMDVIHAKTKIIHRDISPDNIYITKDKKVKLIDFGSAKEVTGSQEGFSVLVKLKLSPPEQYSSNMTQGSFTDVYSLAATYYYALSGINLPPAPDRLNGQNYVPLKQLGLGISESVSDAVDRALILDVGMRTQTMQAFIQGIAPAAMGGGKRVVSSYEAEKLARQREEYERQRARQQGEKAQQAREKAAREQLKKQQELARQRELEKQQEAVRQQREKQQELMRQRQYRGQQAGLKQQGGYTSRQGSAVPYVSVLSGPSAGTSWAIPADQRMRFGRSKTEANLRVEKPEDISRIHCEICYLPKKEQFSIRDVSTYGVFYNGQRLEKGREYSFTPPARFMLASRACIIELGVRYEHH